MKAELSITLDILEGGAVDARWTIYADDGGYLHTQDGTMIDVDTALEMIKMDTYPVLVEHGLMTPPPEDQG